MRLLHNNFPSLQLSFAVVPLVLFTSDQKKMGKFTNKIWMQILAWVMTVIIFSLNVYLLAQTVLMWFNPNN